jgi:hypothetical protein
MKTMVGLTKKRCCNCDALYKPDARNATRQEYCNKPECRKASKTASQKRWLEKPENQNYFCGTSNVQRVQQWRKEHPGYWRKKSDKTDSALQETLNLQPSEKTTDTTDPSFRALQEIINRQPIVLLGLIANMTGSALQDDIDITVRRLLQLGQDIVYHSTQSKGGQAHDVERTYLPRESPPGAQTVQLAGSAFNP